jgi:hypothetical protein
MCSKAVGLARANCYPYGIARKFFLLVRGGPAGEPEIKTVPAIFLSRYINIAASLS